MCVLYASVCQHAQYFWMLYIMPVSIYSTWTSKDIFINESSTQVSAVMDRNIKVKYS